MGEKNSKLKPRDLSELNEQTQFTEEEIKDWYKGFKKDYPHGYLTIEEFKQIYGNFYPGGNASKFAENTFRVFDHNNDGKIDFREFMIGLSMSSKGSFDDKMKWIFQLYDENKNGLISKDEFLVIVQAMHDMSGDAVTEEIKSHVDKVYDNAELDKDGQLTYEAFVKLARTDSTLSAIVQEYMNPK